MVYISSSLYFCISKLYTTPPQNRFRMSAIKQQVLLLDYCILSQVRYKRSVHQQGSTVWRKYSTTPNSFNSLWKAGIASFLLYSVHVIICNSNRFIGKESILIQLSYLLAKLLERCHVIWEYSISSVFVFKRFDLMDYSFQK